MKTRSMLRASVALLLGMTLAACAPTGAITHQVLTPAPSSPLTEFYVEKAQVQSRETGDNAWQRNDGIARRLTEAVRAALQAKGKTLATAPGDTVRSKVYVAYGDADVRTRDTVKGKAHIEIRIEVLQENSGTVRYSTFTVAPITEGLLAKVGVGEESDQLIRDAVDSAAQDFASRL